MSIEYTWQIVKLEAYPQLGDRTDVVFNVFWRLTATEGEYSAATYGNVTLPVEGETFTPYANLTKEQVVGWLQSVLDTEQIEAMLSNEIAALVNPPVVAPPLPWASV